MRIAAEILLQIVDGQHQTQRQTLAVRIQKAAGIEVHRLAAQGAVANNQLIGHAFVAADAEDIFDRTGGKIDDLLEALEKLGRPALVGVAFIAFAADKMRRVAFGQENQVGVNRSAIRADPNNPA